MADEVKQEKERKGIVAWWAGLKKGAKIGITAGGVLVLTGVTVGVVFGVKGCSGNKGETYVLTLNEGLGYSKSNLNLKKNIEYTFTCKVEYSVRNFIITSEETQGISLDKIDIKAPGADITNWALVSENEYGGSPINNCNVTIKVSLNKDVNNATVGMHPAGQ